MKKLFYLFLILGLAVSSCNKPEALPAEVEVSFSASMGGSNFKDGATQFDCTTEGATYAIVIISGTEDTVNLIRDEYGNVYTESIKLPPSPTGGYTLDSFVLYGPDTDGDGFDEQVLAIPLINSAYAQYVTDPLPMDFTVEAFYKNEVPIQVLCFDETVIVQFGFSWFSLDVTAIREICFFGDICVDPNDYVGSLYEGQRNGLQHDMPAIFEIRVSTWNKTTNDWNTPEVIKNNETLEGSSTDAYDWLGESAVLCVKFPDYAGVDTYKIELLVYVSDGNGGFAYQTYLTWNFDDNNFPVTDVDSDGVIDFVIGNCVPGADIIIPPTDPPTEDCEECKDHNGAKITELTLRYSGTVVNPHIIVTGDGASRPILYDGTPGNNPFTFIGQEAEGKFKAKTFVQVVNGGSSLEIHTSCSDPLYVGQVFGGDFEVVSGTLLSGAPLCGSNPDTTTAEDCEECNSDNRGDITELTLRYTGTVVDPHISVWDEKDDIALYDGSPKDYGYEFSVIGKIGPEDKLGTWIGVYFDNDWTVETRIHTSCSKPLYVGQVWGDFLIVSGTLKGGAMLCDDSN